MSIQVLISTMNQRDIKKLVKEMNVKSAIVINQITEKIIAPKDIKSKLLTTVSISERGLSKSRNRAIEAVTADICLIADDDMYYVDSYEKIVTDAYKKYPSADIITFYVDHEDPSLSASKQREGKLGLLETMKTVSYQISFKRNSIKNLRMDETFGTGTDNYMGEENIFLFDCHKKGLKIYHVPIKIATLRKDSVSTWFKGYDETYLHVKGMVFYRMSRMLSLPLIMQFACRKKQLYEKKLSVFEAINLMLAGRKKQMLLMKNKKIYFAGDFKSDNGPAIVNRKYLQHIHNYVYVYENNSKIGRLLHFARNVHKSNTILISGLSVFHSRIISYANFTGKPTYYLMHGYIALESNINQAGDRRKLQRIEKKILTDCTKIICVSEEFSRRLKSDFPDLSSKISHVNNGVDKYEALYQPVKINEEKFKILSYGGGLPIKNNLKICEAISATGRSDISYTVVGAKSIDGDQISSYPFVTYINQMSHQEALELMRSTNLYIQNSLFETFGIAVTEAIQSGTPVLLSASIGLLPLISNITHANVIYDPNDVIEISKKIVTAISNKRTTPRYLLEAPLWSDAAKNLIKMISHEE